MSIIATVDPGLSDGTGVALWHEHEWTQKVCPALTFNLSPEGEADWVYQAELLSKRLGELVEAYDIRKMYIEFPQFFLSETGYAATAKGNIHVLAALIGAYMSVVWARGGTCEPVLVNRWKGQMSKDAVISRIKRIIPEITDMGVRTHSWDAVGLGLWAKGFMNAN